MRARFPIVAAGFALAAVFSWAEGERPLKTFALDIAHGLAPVGQRAVRVAKNDRVRFRITSDEAGEVHLHGYNLEARVVAGKTVDLSVTVNATGRYPLYWHPATEAPRAASGHSAAPLATLEVRPR